MQLLAKQLQLEDQIPSKKGRDFFILHALWWYLRISWTCLVGLRSFSHVRIRLGLKLWATDQFEFMLHLVPC